VPDVASIQLRPTVGGSPPEDTAPRRGTAFGLELVGGFSAPGLWTGAHEAPMRQLSLEVVSRRALERSWPARDAEPLLRRPLGHTGLVLAVDEHSRRGYLVRVDGFGAYLITRDGRRVLLAPGPTESWRWQRLLTAQALPIAALAQGLELFHASAAQIEGRVLAVTGAGGAGKTTLAAALMLAGATFVTDDVLALELARDDLIAHPGPALMNLRESAQRLLSPRDGVLGVELGRDEAATRLLVRRETQALPLQAIYYLRRSSHYDRVRVQALSPPSPGLLLGSAFGTAIQTAGRLVRRLELCAGIARHIGVFTLDAPPQAPPAALARAVLRHARQAGV
jgi:hypothetical protein